MKFHYIQHVPFEAPGYISQYLKNENHSITGTRMFNNERIVDIDTIDFLIVLGGPMSVNEENKIKWITEEKRYIEKYIKSDKPILGICLGAQIIANVIGAKVYKNDEKEIGWFEIKQNIKIIGNNEVENVFHWHGETFDLPKKAIRLSESKGCKNQGFKYDKNVYGLQYHLEMTQETIKLLIENSKEELVNGKYIQSEKEIMDLTKKYCKKSNVLMENLIKNIIEKSICD